GIIHGGLKYMFDGNLTLSARIISGMPDLWREAMAGKRLPDLSGTTTLSDCCYIWGTGSIKSRIFMTGSSIALRTKPTPIERDQWPPALQKVPGKVLRVGEQVIDPASLLQCFSRRNSGRILHIDPDRSPEFERTDGRIAAVRIYSPKKSPNEPNFLTLCPRFLVFTAGQGNAELRHQAGLPGQVMQRRPLHMVMVRGQLPKLFGHCVGGAKPRITVTSATDSAGRTVWQVGGQIAEEGVAKSPAELMAFAKQELLTCLPGLDLRNAEFATYRIDRAEAITATGQKPDDVHVVQDGNVLTAWPTKLALAPRLAERILELLPSPKEPAPCTRDWPMPPVAQLPWEAQRQWFNVP
ncbi:MAG: FAD-dependent oxidoreductase, partial [Bacillota bacterium]